MTRVMPFLKWPGGKRWAAADLAYIMRPHLAGRYFEPFLGGGAVFFALKPRKASLSDINADLINTYKEVKRSPASLITALQTMPVSQDFYNQVRSEAPDCKMARAARFLYLNRTAFSGMYRLNRRGQFNVPYGGGSRRPDSLWDDDLLTNAAAALSRAAIECSDFERALNKAQFGDVAYCDPTYTVAHDNNGFRRYNESVFSWHDQIRLARCAYQASQRGALVIVSNAHHSSVYELYRSFENCQAVTLSRFSCVARVSASRRSVSEYMFVLRPAKK